MEGALTSAFLYSVEYGGAASGSAWWCFQGTSKVPTPFQALDSLRNRRRETPRSSFRSRLGLSTSGSRQISCSSSIDPCTKYGYLKPVHQRAINLQELPIHRQLSGSLRERRQVFHLWAMGCILGFGPPDQRFSTRCRRERECAESAKHRR